MGVEEWKPSLAEARAYETLFREMPCDVTVRDRDRRILETNRRFEERFGSRRGEQCWEVCKQRVLPCQDCVVERTFATGQGQSAQETVVTLKGEEVPMMTYTAPIRDDAGEVTRVLHIAADITGVRRLQQKLHRTHQRLLQLFEEAPCYISVQDRDLRLDSLNRRFKEDFGDEVGRYCYEVYKHRDEPCLECPVARTFADGTSHRSEEVVTCMSGDQRNVLVHTAPIRSSSGEITQVMEMSTNITEIRQLENRLTSLGLLIGSVSHGVKGLLTAIDGGMYLVNSGLAKEDRVRVEQGWAIVQRNMRRVRSMMLDILYYSRGRELEYETFNAVELAEDLWSIVAHRAEELGVSLEREFQVAAGAMEADRTALRTVMVNVLENALDACRLDKKASAHVVWLGVRSGPGDTVEFEVRDDGIGMDRETREMMFTIFFTSKGKEGTGLGMYDKQTIKKREKVSSVKHGSQCPIKTCYSALYCAQN